ncbi:alanine racemase [Novosphingobium rosa]|uniref:alanine racemase n=1 Tax=Novosphingobium rosa TaxID=76978 RepID=UPI00082E3B98|nr:alanine racemase [Novosphingobium rosa]
MIGGARLTIDLEALAANYCLIRDAVAPAQVGGVVKANGYGLGASVVAPVLIAQGCRHIFVAVLGEAEALAPDLPSGINLYVLNGLMPGTEAHCAQLGAIPVLNSLDQIARWSAQAAVLGRRLPAVLQVDTGMSRMGLPADELESLLADPALLDGIEPKLLISHLACADAADDPANTLQAGRFHEIARRFPGLPLALDNSGGAFHAREHFDLVRAGIGLYGGAPHDGPNPMRPVIALDAAIAQLRTIPAGAGVGYGLTFHTERETRIATIPVGYADGLPRCLGNKGAAWIACVRAPIVGRVSMDSITLDVTDVPEAALYPGAPVELIGPHQSLDQLATDAGTISYEILTQLGRRYQRVLLPATGAATTRSIAP